MSRNGKKGSRLWRIVKRTILVLFIAQLAYIVLLKWVDPPLTLTQLGAVIGGDGLKRDYISEVPVNMKLAVIASEDQLFPDHGGFDWKSIEKAQAYNKRKPGRVHGASTISQQTAKNVFLWQGRSWLRKGLEVYFTKMIEWIWGKERILEVYLNVIEMGRGVYGVEAAAQHYFGKPAAGLSRREAALIAACLPAPKRCQPANGGYVQRRASSIVANMAFLQRDPDVQRVIGLGTEKAETGVKENEGKKGRNRKEKK
ncbi:monofunctional biosynthetic peptidoglycan transglycosylase [Flaviaesturariibacter aridisoli]|uniref:monofunctional biosynthetic peptidoglycan transglycosylase n=1 Tax=Flaviaesturariibacter aridisoli TaxID=2545761 RepID=UPI001404CF75|nr:monofunctional biosynthetic peptidoglycan transglycosylase [Flaviaesturariibacter aridisoli]